MKLIELSSTLYVVVLYYMCTFTILFVYNSFIYIIIKIKLVLYCMYGGNKNGISIPLTKFVIVRLILSRRRVLYSTEYG